MSDSEQTPHSPLTCPACQVIDKLDGHEDGKIFDLAHWSVASEKSRWDSMRKAQDEVADKVTNFAGSLNFVYLHGLWFAIWIALNVGLIGAGLMFDKYPFGLLTMIVSLEAIFLSTFVMVSQNRQASRSEVRAEVDFESNLQSLIWIVHLAQKLDVDIVHVQQLCTDAVAESRKVEQ